MLVAGLALHAVGDNGWQRRRHDARGRAAARGLAADARGLAADLYLGVGWGRGTRGAGLSTGQGRQMFGDRRAGQPNCRTTTHCPSPKRPTDPIEQLAGGAQLPLGGISQAGNEVRQAQAAAGACTGCGEAGGRGAGEGARWGGRQGLRYG